VASSKKKVIDPTAPRLRVSQVWRDEVMDERILAIPDDVTLGSDRSCTFVAAAELRLPPTFHLFRHGERGYVLTLGVGMGGEIHLGGRTHAVADVVSSARGDDSAGAYRAVPVADGDWGVIHLDAAGEHVIFFQFVRPEAPIGTGRLMNDELWLPALVFSLALHAVFITSNWYFAGNPPGNLGFEQTDVLAGILVQRPEEPEPPGPQETPPQAGLPEAEEKAPPASAEGSEGKSGGEGKKPRERDPDPGDTAPVAEIKQKVRNRGLLVHSDKLAAIGSAMPSDRLGSALSKLKGPNNGGGAGYGGGKGTGVGAGTGTGTLTRSSGTGVGGGGTAHADVVTQGKIDTGGTRAAKGTPGGTGLGEKKVSVAIGDGEGDFDGLTKDQVMKVVMARRTMFQACFEKELQRLPNLSGTVMISWHIEAGGAVSISKLKSSTMGNAAVESCLVRRVKDLKFPASPDGRPTDVRFPFVFASRR
jgi:hypothetical protein